MLIRERREQKNLSLKQLAEMLDVSSAALSRWETGKRPLPEGRYEQIAAALDLEMDMLAGEKRFARQSDLNAWRDLIWEDDTLTANSMLVLLWMSRKTRKVDGKAAYLGDIEGTIRLVRNLTSDQVVDAWPEATSSPYVEIDKDGVIFFTFPAQH